jgi:gentisate 1,2-dioxygenase
VPWLWRWKTLRELAERAGELITIDRGGDRRVLSLANPGLEGAPYATSTLWGAVQYLNPGEHAGAHRHTPGAIRFVLEGDGVYTTVNGDACDMHPGDLVLTPSWNWHDHNSASDRPMIWFDGLDMPTVNALDAIFFELYPDEMLQPIEARNRSERRYPSKGLLPAGAGAAPGPGHSPLLAYRWADTDAALDGLLAENGGPMASLEFTDPTTGRPVMPTMACEMHRIMPGKRTATTRKVGSSVLVAYRGAGASVINGTRFEWGPGDMLAVPSWATVDHQTSEPSDLFAISDAPVLKALGLYREITLSQPQEVASTFPG